MEKSIRVFAPASVSNVGPGFDLMGFAINDLGDEVIVRKNNINKIRIVKITGDNARLTKDIFKNTATVGVIELLKYFNLNVGLDFEIHKKMGIGSGLGSSAASAAAAVFAVNYLLELKLTKSELLPFAMIGEKAASGSIHADNVAPSLLGGIRLITSYKPLQIQKINFPNNLFCSIVYPNIEIKTFEARKILPKSLSRKKTIAQAGRLASLILAFEKGDFDLLSKVIIDEIAEPKRATLLPCYELVKTFAMINGAFNCNISGSGPAMFSFSDSKKNAVNIASAMREACKQKELNAQIYVTKINRIGTRILE